jgi:ABC-type sugar transport system permease subunit
MLLGFLTSFTNYEGLSMANLRFVDLTNYSRAFTGDPEVGFSLGRTLLWGLFNLPARLILSFVARAVIHSAIHCAALTLTTDVLVHRGNPPEVVTRP